MRKLKKLTALFIAFAMTIMLFPCSASAESSEEPESVYEKMLESVTSANNYGLTGELDSSRILYAWNWSFENIEANLENIALQGFGGILVSPPNEIKMPTKDVKVSEPEVEGISPNGWWMFYEPAGFQINESVDNALGTKDDFISLCEGAEGYGIKIMVETVVGYVGTDDDHVGEYDNTSTDPLGHINPRANEFEPELIAAQAFHFPWVNCTYQENYWDGWSDYDIEESLTQHAVLRKSDLATENQLVQDTVYDYLVELTEAGADGFYFNDAKHIETKSDTYFASDFWDDTLSKLRANYPDKELYAIGEVKGSIGDGRKTEEYTPYMDLTDTKASINIMDNLVNGDADIFDEFSFVLQGNTVLQAETKELYTDGSTSALTVEQRNKIWALSAARKDVTSLYFARPDDTAADDKAEVDAILAEYTLGDAHRTAWAGDEVKAVNQFANFFKDEEETTYFEDDISVIERGDSGAVLVNIAGSETEVSFDTTALADGKYEDSISGNEFTVSGGVLSGEIGETGIAVLYRTVNNSEIVLGKVTMKDGDYLLTGADEVTHEAPASGGYAHFKDGVLTLNNYSYEGEGYTYNIYYMAPAVIYSKSAVSVVLEGNNTLINTYDLGGTGIFSNDKITISGEGTLNIEADDGCIYSLGGVLIKSGTLNLKTEFCGIRCHNKKTVISGGKIYIDSDDYGIYSESYAISIDDAYVDIDAEGYAIYGGGGLTVENTDILIPAGGSINEGTIIDGGHYATRVLLAETIEHNWSEEYSNNYTHHWHTCLDEDCYIVNCPEACDGYEKHSREGICVCGYDTTKAIECATEEELIELMDDGVVNIILTDDITLTDYIHIENSLVLDLGGNKLITGDGGINAFNAEKVHIKNGTITSGNDESYGDIDVNNELIFEDVTVINNGIYIYHGSLTLNGGSYEYVSCGEYGTNASSMTVTVTEDTEVKEWTIGVGTYNFDPGDYLNPDYETEQSEDVWYVNIKDINPSGETVKVWFYNWHYSGEEEFYLENAETGEAASSYEIEWTYQTDENGDILTLEETERLEDGKIIGFDLDKAYMGTEAQFKNTENNSMSYIISLPYQENMIYDPNTHMFYPYNMVAEGEGVALGDIVLCDGEYHKSGADEVTYDKPRGGYAYFKDGVLTLNDYILDSDCDVGIVSFADIEIRLSGVSKIGSPDNRPENGIYVAGNLNITGDGDLTMYASDDGVELNAGYDMTISDGNITIYASDDGIDMDGNEENYTDLTIDDGNLIIHTDDKAIDAEGVVTVNDGSLDITSDTDDGINCKAFIGNGGSVTIYTGDDGIDADEEEEDTDCGKITISGGTYNITGGDSCLEADNLIAISGGRFDLLSDQDEVKTEEPAIVCYNEEGAITLDGINITKPKNAKVEFITHVYEEGYTEECYVVVDGEGNIATKVEINKPSSGGSGGGGGGSFVTSTTTKNDDGSTTKTTTNKSTGTITEVTTNTDGSTATVETKKDGTVTTTEKDKDGNTTTTVEKPDGSRITEEIRKDGTEVKTETTADGDTTAEVKSKSETEVVIPVPNADKVTKVTVTDKDGNETEITDFEPTSYGVKISVSGDCTVVVSEAAKKEFEDVHHADHWATADIDYAYINGLMMGTSETHFSPDVPLTRAMLVTVLYRLEGEPRVSGITSFADLGKGQYYLDAVCWAQINGIVNGVSETEFAPNSNITREQIAAILYRYAIYRGMDAVNLSENLTFTDADEISEYVISALNWAVGTRLINGYEDNTVRPLNNATRAEVAAILHRFIEANK